jgi:hypothetical protein
MLVPFEPPHGPVDSSYAHLGVRGDALLSGTRVREAIAAFSRTHLSADAYAPDTQIPLPIRFVVDTCFLMNLVQCTTVPSTAQRRWREFLACRKQQSEMYAFWTPSIYQEFLYAMAYSLLRLSKTGPEDDSARALYTNLTALLSRHPSLRDALAPTPAFCAAVLPLLQESLQAFEQHLVIAPDAALLVDEQSFAAYQALLATGLLPQADCLTVLTALSVNAGAILTDDHHLVRAAQLLGHLGIKILT